VVKPRRISDFKPTLTNLAQTSHYQLSFGGLPLGLRQHLNVRGLDYRFITETSGLLCSNAVLPGSANAIANIRGNFTGVVENMSHARIFTEIVLEFYVDREYKALKFFEHWIEFIANGSGEDQSKKNYYFRMEYPDDYKTYGAKLVKFDRDYKEEMQYNFYGLFPRNLSNTPVKYEGSEVLKVSVSMAFDRYSAGKYSSYNRYRGDYNNIKAENAKKRAEVQAIMDDGGYSRQEAIQILDGGLETVIE
tara:strand:- start:264 stop:1007 length:744 start_codon:yes stop_codon:yes gene_type:complete